MRLIKPLGGAAALVVAAIVGGTLMSSVFAAPSTSTSPAATLAADGAHGAYCQAFIDAFASELGISTDDLGTAARAAAASTIDAAVAAGDLTAERAATLKQRLAAAGDGCAALAGRFPFAGPHRGGMRGHRQLGDLVGAAATSLGIDRADLVQRIRGGETLADVAAAEDVAVSTVTDAVTSALQAALDDAVAAGTITQERADAIAEHVGQELADGTWPDRGNRRHGFRGGEGASSPAEVAPAT